ncbi:MULTISPECIES: hypothetical protein [unclassified Nonomuraea]|uniref:hypothetical protein n=1 Tax=unclassified Nonomuraea TaxID=2593643 RepID=UPI0033E5BB2E
MKIFGREPAAILYALQAVLAVLVAFGVFGLTDESAAWVLTIGNGVMALIVAVVTRPFVVSALTGAVQTILTAAIAFGLPVTEAQMGSIIAALSIILGLTLRPNVAPEQTAVTRA